MSEEIDFNNVDKEIVDYKEPSTINIDSYVAKLEQETFKRNIPVFFYQPTMTEYFKVETQTINKILLNKMFNFKIVRLTENRKKNMFRYLTSKQVKYLYEKEFLTDKNVLGYFLEFVQLIKKLNRSKTGRNTLKVFFEHHKQYRPLTKITFGKLSKEDNTLLNKLFKDYKSKILSL